MKTEKEIKARIEMFKNIIKKYKNGHYRGGPWQDVVITTELMVENLEWVLK